MNKHNLFPMSSKLILIPHWVDEALHRHGMSTSEILNFSKVRTVLSMSDLVSVMALQSFADKIVGPGGVVRDSITYEWTASASSEEDKEFLTKQMWPLAGDEHQRDLVSGQLFSEESSSGYKQAYKVVALDDKAIGVIIYPGFFTEARAADHHLNVIRDVLKQLYVYEEHSSVAATPLTLRYLELLSDQTV